MSRRWLDKGSGKSIAGEDYNRRGTGRSFCAFAKAEDGQCAEGCECAIRYSRGAGAHPMGWGTQMQY